jgi:hypothetical protein
MQVTVRSESGEERSWTLPKALLSHYSGYFTRLRNFKEGEEGAVVLQDFDMVVFRSLKDPNKIRDSAKAWVFGDYFDATEFKNFATRGMLIQRSELEQTRLIIAAKIR